MSLVNEQEIAIEAIRNLGNLEARFVPILTITNVLISQRQATRESLDRLGQAAARVLEGFKLSKQGLTTIIERINKAVADGTTLQTEQLSRLRQSLEASVAGNNSEDAINDFIAEINVLISEIDQEIPPLSSQPPPQRGGFVWRTPPKTPNTPRLTLNKTTSPVRNNVLIRTKTRKTRTKTKKSNLKTIITRISRRTRSKSRS